MEHAGYELLCPHDDCLHHDVGSGFKRKDLFKKHLIAPSVADGHEMSWKDATRLVASIHNAVMPDVKRKVANINAMASAAAIPVTTAHHDASVMTGGVDTGLMPVPTTTVNSGYIIDPMLLGTPRPAQEYMLPLAPWSDSHQGPQATATAKDDADIDGNDGSWSSFLNDGESQSYMDVEHNDEAADMSAM